MTTWEPIYTPFEQDHGNGAWVLVLNIRQSNYVRPLVFGGKFSEHFYRILPKDPTNPQLAKSPDEDPQDPQIASQKKLTFSIYIYIYIKLIYIYIHIYIYICKTYIYIYIHTIFVSPMWFQGLDAGRSPGLFLGPGSRAG